MDGISGQPELGQNLEYKRAMDSKLLGMPLKFSKNYIGL